MWLEIDAQVQNAICDNRDTINHLSSAQSACNGDGEAALAKMFLMDLLREANDLDIKIRRFALGINPAAKAEAERSEP